MKPIFRLCPHGGNYMADGGGRDSYILENQGGNFKVSSLMPASRRMQSPTRGPPRPRLDGRLVNYKSDGSGRDSYVQSSRESSPIRGGGFASCLRGYTPSNREGLVTSKTQKRLRQRFIELQRLIKQDNIAFRLSLPKKKRIKHPNSILNPSGLSRIPY